MHVKCSEEVPPWLQEHLLEAIAHARVREGVAGPAAQTATIGSKQLGCCVGRVDQCLLRFVPFLRLKEVVSDDGGEDVAGEHKGDKVGHHEGSSTLEYAIHDPREDARHEDTVHGERQARSVTRDIHIINLWQEGSCRANAGRRADKFDEGCPSHGCLGGIDGWLHDEAVGIRINDVILSRGVC
eukprot:CAMPEP_0115876978 /NCGR_PEP_ID=MMETSP0287-20121206/25967_1 /TAXON_ID=412157 /ORGANISM="Chrysochromulina rotalis, Strain UIO044" /LENGTH=183 /DNA_ID=CAMNT_0003332441 /DNA_START=36 /DNA_END=588 /DNA_ORIENTATION=+